MFWQGRKKYNVSQVKRRKRDQINLNRFYFVSCGTSGSLLVSSFLQQNMFKWKLLLRKLKKKERMNANCWAQLLVSPIRMYGLGGKIDFIHYNALAVNSMLQAVSYSAFRWTFNNGYKYGCVVQIKSASSEQRLDETKKFSKIGHPLSRVL